MVRPDRYSEGDEGTHNRRSYSIHVRPLRYEQMTGRIKLSSAPFLASVVVGGGLTVGKNKECSTELLTASVRGEQEGDERRVRRAGQKYDLKTQLVT